MTATPPLPTGLLRLVARRAGARTVLASVERTAPFHPGPLSYRRDGFAETIVQEVGPGLLPGDRLDTGVTVESGAALIVRAQGATRVYPAPTGAPAESRVHLRVEAGAALWWLPGEVIPFRDAVLRTETTADLAPGARLALLDILTSGRIAMAERDAYARLDLRLRIDVGGKPALVERANLEPTVRPPTSPGRHGAFPCVGTLVLVGYDPPVGRTWAPDAPTFPSAGTLRSSDALEQTLHGAGGLWSGGDAGNGLFVARVAGASAQEVRAALLGLLDDVAARCHVRTRVPR